MAGGGQLHALEAHGLGKRYKSRLWALRSVDWALPTGAITALVGPNGAGKSTLMKAWVGFERPTEGSVAVLGIDPWQDRRAAVIQVGYVAQTPSLYRELSADDHLALAQTLRRTFDRGLARRRLQQLGIPFDARPTELSGGQQAQLGLALALGTRAPVLLLDEPLASLDPLARREFLAVLVEAVREEGSTAVLSSHIITDVEAACGRVVVLSGGRKLLDATVPELIADHVIAPSLEELTPGRFVAAFEGPAGEPLILARRDGTVTEGLDRPATLEEVVIGFLAAGRSPAVGS
ncbi:MAG: ABC transporter ATP-binding protein [Chloroflexi bacterium]|nr:ABC transporter ATP-binding protein [Chloroflexota bacterium]